MVSRKRNTPCPKNEKSFPSTAVRCASSPISAPATNDFSPAPVSISTRTAASSRASSSASRNSSTVLRFSAFSTFGRFKVTKAIPSLFSTSKFSNPIFISLVRWYPNAVGAQDSCVPPWQNLKLHRFRFLRIRIIIKSPPGLPPVPSRQNHPLQQRWRRKSPLAKLFKHNIRDVIRRIQPHEIQQRQRTHRMPAS